MKLLTFPEIVKRLEIAFPECDISFIQRVIVGDVRQRVKSRPAIQIGMAEKLDDIGGQNGH